MATGDRFDELFSRFSRREAVFADVMKAESSNAENRYLSKARAQSFAETESRADTIRQMQAESGMIKRKIARYESELHGFILRADQVRQKIMSHIRVQ